MLKLAFCGNDCNNCPRYIATQTGSIERLKEVAALWYRVGYRDKIVPPEDMICRGCSSANWCSYTIRECALEKSVENCGKCKNYPCEKVLKIFERNELFAEKSKKICSKEEYECLQKAFFSKKENLDKVYKEYLSKVV